MPVGATTNTSLPESKLREVLKGKKGAPDMADSTISFCFPLKSECPNTT